MLNLSSIESALYSTLNPILGGFKSSITPIFPRTLQDLENRESVVVMNYIGDSIEGMAISQAMLQPEFTFIAFTGEYITARRVQVKEIEIMVNQVDANDYSNVDVIVTSYYKLRRSPVTFDNKSEMYMASVDYKFFVQEC